MKNSHRSPLLKNVLIASALVALTACESAYPPTPPADNTIHVTETTKGAVATPPGCRSWATDNINPYDEQPLPQFGCANARDLAMMVENPEDLVHGRDFGYGNPVTTVGAMRRYNANQTRGLLDVGASADMSQAATTSSTSTSAINGDSPSSPSSSSSAGGSSAAASP